MKKIVLIIGLFLSMQSVEALDVSKFVGHTKAYGSFLDIPSSHIKNFYKERGGQSVWIGRNGSWTSEARTVIGFLQRSAEEGLRPRDYAASKFKDNLHQLNMKQTALADLMLTAAFMQYIVDQHAGRRELRNLDALKYKGGHYNPDPKVMMKKALQSRNLSDWIRSIAPQGEEYPRLKKVLANLYEMKREGGWPVLRLRTKKPLTLNANHADVKILRQILRIHGDLRSSSTSSRFDKRVRNALISYQQRHGVNATGWVDKATRKVLQVPIEDRIRQVIVSMERWRWIPAPSDGKFIRVNIAGFHLTAYDKRQAVFSRKVIVGSRYRQTPTLAAPMTEIKFNPVWTVPRSIMTKDFLPKFKKDPGAFRRHNFWLVDNKGRKITQNVNWHNYSAKNFPYYMKQRGGKGNALGHIRFTIITPFNIYLHDTSNRSLFNNVSRTLSSGCIRVEDPHVLGAFVLNNSMEWGADDVKRAMESGRFKKVQLPQPVNVYLLYVTAWADSKGTPYFFTDVYKRDKIIARYLGI